MSENSTLEAPTRETQIRDASIPDAAIGEGPSGEIPIKIDLKLFATDESSVEAEELISVFHRWIQTGPVDDLLIDVADYSHVPEGPGVILVAHDAQYQFDLGQGRPGLLYSRRRETHPSLQGLTGLEGRLVSVLRAALTAGRKLESESSLAGRLRFRGDEMLLRLNDRLRAPATDQTEAVVRPALEALLERLYPGTGFRVEREGDPRDPFTLRIRSERSVPVAMLLARLGDPGVRPVSPDPASL